MFTNMFVCEVLRVLLIGGIENNISSLVRDWCPPTDVYPKLFKSKDNNDLYHPGVL